MLSRYLNIAIPILLFALIAFNIKAFPIYDYDNWCWTVWASHDLKEGLSNAYNDPNSPMRTNYLPVFHYILYVFGLICGSEKIINENVHYIKLATLAIDWLGLWYIYKWIDKKIAFYWLVILSLVNIAYSYNTLIWGQVDGIVATFAFISTYYGFHRKTALSALFFILALNTKLQAIIFFPVWGFFYLQHALEQRTLKSFLLPLMAMAATQFVILIPFLGTIDRILEVAFNLVGQYPHVSVMAFNYWHIALGDGVWNLPDTGNYIGGITYRQFGFATFFLCSFLALLPMLRVLYTRMVAGMKRLELTREQVWLICAVLGLCFFFFNTQMHERYSHPAFIFIAAYAFYTKRFLPYIIFSAAYFLNVEKVGAVMHLSNYHTAIYNHVFIAALFGVLLLYLLVKLWLSFKPKQLQ
ncbi:hypothetical protein [Polluticoccus soli]|uniref:hypothetical protein n=1 Tax=Polluticoccus soli TaxID=3034150 RepID=UPI0023E31E49|nr:hypothetical protein [Flavipsychrobacter sp. JY13-12]